MLAVLGFSSAAIIFLLFSFSLPELKNKQSHKLLEKFRYAYLFLALAFWIFGMASAVKNLDILAFSVLVGNVLILIATYFIVDILFEFNKHKKQILAAYVIISALFMIFRIIYHYPTPYIQDSILIFNSPRYVNFTLASIFILIWLPVNLRMARLTTSHVKNAQGYSNAYTYLFFAATFAAAMFVMSKKPAPLVISFTALVISFLMLVIANYSVNGKRGRSHGRK